MLTVNGVCGSSNGLFFLSTPNVNLCSAGNTGSLSGSGPWSWACNGINSGTNANCNALLSVNGVCGSSHGLSFLSTPNINLCSAGNA